MVDQDLRKLSARIEALRPEVDEAYKRLDAKWARLSSHIEKLPIPCTVGYTFWNSDGSDEESRLEWRKWNGKKRFCISMYAHLMEVETVTPFEEWSAEQRIAMLSFIPELFESAEKQIKAFIDKTRDEEVNQ